MDRRSFLRTSTALAGAVPLLGDQERRFGPVDAQFDELVAVAETAMIEFAIPGAAIGVVKDGTRMVRGLGITSIEHPRPVDPDTLFQLASVSKTFVATAMMRLVDSGRVALDEPVRTYLTDLPIADQSVAREVTVRHLLTHTPGWEGQLAGTSTPAEAVTRLDSVPQLARPGEVWSYNNAGYRLAARIIEVVTGKDSHTSTHELLLDPLGLSMAFSNPDDYVTYPLALGHLRSATGYPTVQRPVPLSLYVGGSGIVASLEAVLSYGEFHLRADRTDILSAASFEEMRRPFIRKVPTQDAMAVGWHLRTVGGVTTLAHGGTVNSCCLHIQLVPDRALAFAVLTNHVDGWQLIQRVEAAALRLYGQLELARGQALGHRGVNESASVTSEPLAVQPDLRAYAGSFGRPPLGSYTLLVEGNELRLKGSGVGPSDTRLVFYGEDLAYGTEVPGFPGQPVEFIRDAQGDVTWIRVNGRIGRKGLQT